MERWPVMEVRPDYPPAMQYPVFLHEFGHMFGLKDTYVPLSEGGGGCLEGQPDSVMCKVVRFHQLQQDDIDGIRAVFRRLHPEEVVAGRQVRVQPDRQHVLGVTIREARVDGGGIMILDVAPGSIAERGGLYPGVIITRFNGTRIRTEGDFTSAQDAVTSGRVVLRGKNNVFQDKQELTFTLNLPENSGSSGDQYVLGVVIDEARIDGGGIMILDVAPGSVAERGGLNPGVIITTFNGTRVRTEGDFTRARDAITNGRAVLREKNNVFQDNQELTFTLNWPESSDSSGGMRLAGSTDPHQEVFFDAVMRNLTPAEIERERIWDAWAAQLATPGAAPIECLVWDDRNEN